MGRIGKRPGRARRVVVKEHKLERALIKHYDANLTYYSPASDTIFDIMKKVSAPVEGSMLDVGCGDGRAYMYAKRNEMSYVGVDYSQNRISKAQDTYFAMLQEDEIRPVFRHTDVYEALPNTNPGYELVICFELLEHLEEPEVIWAEMKRIATQLVVCTCPVNMPHKAHLQVFVDEAALRDKFTDITSVTRIKCKTHGGKMREHFLFTYVPED